jgi:hypothetical protein
MSGREEKYMLDAFESDFVEENICIDLASSSNLLLTHEIKVYLNSLNVNSHTKNLYPRLAEKVFD